MGFQLVQVIIDFILLKYFSPLFKSPHEEMWNTPYYTNKLLPIEILCISDSIRGNVLLWGLTLLLRLGTQ